MAPLVGVAVEFSREAPVGLGRDHRLGSRLGQGLAQPVRVKRPVRKQLSAREPLDERRGATQIVGLAGQQAEVDQVAKRVGQRHDFRRHAAARAPDSLAFGPPFAP